MTSKEKTPETNKVKEIDKKALAKIEREVSVIEQEIERILLERRILHRSERIAKEKEFN